MTLLADKDERFKGLFVKVSVFVLLALVGVALNFLYAAVRQGLFLHKTPVYFVAPTSEGIHEGMAVKLSGFKIGTVKKIMLDESAETRVEMLIEKQYMHFLHQDAEVTTGREGVIGDSVLSISRGSENKPLLKAGGKISFEQSGGLEQLTQDLRDRLYPAISDMSKLLHEVSSPKGDIRQTLKNLRELTASLKQTRAHLDALLQNSNTMVSEDVRPMLHSLNQTITMLDRDLPQMLDKANATMDSLKKSGASVQSAVESSAPQVSGLVGESRELVDQTRKTVDALNHSWLLRSDIPAEQHGPVRMDSGD